MNLQNILPWVLSNGTKIIVILIIAWLIDMIAKIIISKSIKIIIERAEKITGKDSLIQEQRAKTLRKVFKSTLSVIIWTAAFLTILPELGVNIAPLLAGAGLAGLAIGMGAKNLIQDYLAGLFILLEDQYRVGEEVKIGDVQGKVRDLNLRRTVIEDSKGIIHYTSNGQIKTTSNLSRK